MLYNQELRVAAINPQAIFAVYFSLAVTVE